VSASENAAAAGPQSGRGRPSAQGRSDGPFAALVAAALLATACAAPQAPEALVELRRIAAGEPMRAAEKAAPDLAAESARSLRLAEKALSRRDAAAASRMATLGRIQAETAFAIARQQAAEARLGEAERRIALAEEDMARYRSEQADAEREIQRLEAAQGRASPGAGAVGSGDDAVPGPAGVVGCGDDVMCERLRSAGGSRPAGAGAPRD